MTGDTSNTDIVEEAFIKISTHTHTHIIIMMNDSILVLYQL